MQGRGRAPGFGPRPPYQPGMQQGTWNQYQQPQHNHFQQQHPSAQPAFPQQYALVPINSPGMNGPGVMHGPPGPVVSLGPQGLSLGHSIMPIHMAAPKHAPGGINSFNANMGVLVGSPVGAHPPAGPRPPPGQPPGRTPGRGGPPGRGIALQGRGGPPGPGGRGPPLGRGRGRGPPGGGGPQQRGGRMLASPASKEDRRTAKAMAKLDKQVQAEKPRVYKTLSAEDSQEVARWQADRRKHYPSTANLERKAQAASDRQTRGELEPDQALRRKQLQQVLIRQRELGLQQIAGTEDMHIEGAGPLPSCGRGGRGRGGRGGRFDRGGGRGRSPWGRGRPGRGPPSAQASGAKRPLAEGQGPGQDAGKRLRADGAADGLAGLMQYGSDDDAEEEQAGGAASEGGAEAQANAGSAPQTEEERQALYQKHKEQVERQQQQHLASVEKKKKLQEKWMSQGRGRGRGAPGRGGAGRNSNQNAQQAQHAKRQPTLLQKLLVKDIRRDHSQILQCFRFFVNNNFLQDVGAKPLVFPDPPPTLRDILPSLPEEGGSEASDVDEDDVIHATASSVQAEDAADNTAAEESESESEEESGE